MSDNNKYVLIGYSGHGLVVAEAAMDNGLSVLYYTDKIQVNNNPFGLAYIGDESDEHFTGWQKGWGFLLGIGNNIVRETVAKNVLQHNEQIITVIHGDASISKNAVIEQGSFVARGVCVNAFANIGEYVILNTGCLVDHGCKVQNGAHIAPGAVLAGDVTVGKRTFIGANAVIKQGVTIGDDILIGAGAVVVKDILKPGRYAGNPARIIL